LSESPQNTDRLVKVQNQLAASKPHKAAMPRKVQKLKKIREF
jgi:hypothetical protein